MLTLEIMQQMWPHGDAKVSRLLEGIAAAAPGVTAGGAANHIAGLPISDVCISDDWPRWTGVFDPCARLSVFRKRGDVAEAADVAGDDLFFRGALSRTEAHAGKYD